MKPLLPAGIASLALGLACVLPARQVGTLNLTPCGSAGAWCGTLRRPLDPAAPAARQVDVYFEFYAHTGPGAAAGTLVATEGGPGYPTTGSRDDYLALFRPLMGERDVVLMDNRGTGRSGAVDCHALQTGPHWTTASIAACGTSLGDAAPLYSTAFAADDLAAVLTALGADKIDLYGNSYGTYFAQVFAVRHPRALRSIVLDGAYPLNGPDYAWYPSYAPATRNKFNVACRRDDSCAATGGDSLDRLLPVLAQLRVHPIAARAFDVDGVPQAFTANGAQLATLMFAAAPALTSLRELDAAARAFDGGDAAPLLRLMAETIAAVDSRDPTANPARWSAGLAAAVMCQDPPQIVDLSLPPQARALAYTRALAGRRASHPDGFAPFSLDEFRAMPLDYSLIGLCEDWPSPPASHAAGQVVAVDATYPDIPSLIVSGEFDNVTTVADGAAVAARFPHGRQLLIANSFHVNALPRARSACAAAIVRRFIASLAPGDVSCAAQVPALRLLPRFARRSLELTPAVATDGNQASRVQLQLVAAAVYGVGDAVARLHSHTGTRGVGLRGGDYRIVTHGSAVRVALKDMAWTDDVAVSGVITTTLERDARVTARLEVKSPDTAVGHLEIHWEENEAAGPADARISGALSGTPVRAHMRAP